MISAIKNWLRKNIPQNILTFFRPLIKGTEDVFVERFIEIFDEVSNKSFSMYLRQDTWIESNFHKDGLYGDWEKTSLLVWAFLAKNAEVIIDIGANTGCYALVAQNNNANASIIAIEPIDINFEILLKNISQNKFPIIAEKIALSNEDGIATMYMIKDKLNYMTSVNDNRYENHPEIKGVNEVVPIQVQIKTFDFIAIKHQLTNINLVKIDIEGHELAVLKSMEKYLIKYHPSILIEVIGDENAVGLDKLFRELGYETFLSIDEQNGLKIEDKLWDNGHANFLVCQKEIIKQIPELFFT